MSTQLDPTAAGDAGTNPNPALRRFTLEEFLASEVPSFYDVRDFVVTDDRHIIALGDSELGDVELPPKSERTTILEPRIRTDFVSFTATSRLSGRLARKILNGQPLSEIGRPEVNGIIGNVAVIYLWRFGVDGGEDSYEAYIVDFDGVQGGRTGFREVNGQLVPYGMGMIGDTSITRPAEATEFDPEAKRARETQELLNGLTGELPADETGDVLTTELE